MKICVVEDETIVRRSIVSKINHLQLDVDVFDVAFGYEALDKIRLIRPDLIITDILMPELDGLELLQLVKEAQPAVQVVLLTGYNEFDYAKRALRLGAVDYLAKPVDPEELKAIIAKIQEQQLQQMQHELELLSRQFVQSGVDLGEPRLLRASPWLDANCRKSVLLGTTAQMDEYVQANPSQCIASFRDWNGPAAVIRIADGTEEHSFTNGSEFPEVFRKEMNRWESARFFRSERSGRGSEGERPNVTRAVEASRWNALHAAKSLDYSRFEQCLNQWFEHVRKLKLAALKKECALMMACLDEGLIAEHEVQVVEVEKLQYWKGWIDQWPTWAELEAHMLRFMLKGVRALIDIHQAQNDGRNEGAKPGIVEQAEEMIRRSNGVLHLEEAADRLYVHPVTLSRLFKKTKGVHFIQFVTEIKMQQAAKLLKTSELKISEIASQIGYTDAKYFSLQFKKTYGITPNEYRKQHGNG